MRVTSGQLVQSPKSCPPSGRSAGHVFAGWLAATLLMAAGCRTQPHVNAHIESVNAEYRQLEDYVYALEAENARLQQELDSLRSSRPASRRSEGPSGPARGGTIRNRPADTAPSRTAPSPDAGPEFEPPVIEVPTGSPPASGVRSTLQRQSAEPPADTPPNIEIPATEARQRAEAAPSKPNPAEQDLAVAESPPTDKKVTHLFLNPALTSGADFDGQPGDDGLRIVVEPRNADEQFIAEAGALSIVVLDPTRQGEAARIARWDFDRAATRQLLADAAPRPGMRLELPWPAAAPAANRLQLFVRYEAPDGRRVQADRELFLTPPGQAVSRWTPRSADRPIPPTEAAVTAHQATHERVADAPASPHDQENSPTAKRLWPNWAPQR